MKSLWSTAAENTGVVVVMCISLMNDVLFFVCFLFVLFEVMLPDFRMSEAIHNVDESLHLMHNQLSLEF